MPDALVFPEVNALGERLIRQGRNASGAWAEYAVPPALTECVYCGERVEGNHLVAVTDGAELVGFLSAHAKCAQLARGKRHRRAARPLMATGESSGDWRAIEAEQQAARGSGSARGDAARVVGGNAPALPDSSEAT